MGAVGTLLRGWRAAKPVLDTVRQAESDAEDGGVITVLTTDPSTDGRLRALLGAPTVRPAPLGSLLVHAAAPGRDPVPAARDLADHLRRGGDGALVILLGTTAERHELERQVLAVEPLEMSHVAHAPSLEGPGAKRALEAVLRALGDEALAAGARYPELRPHVAEHLIARASRRAAAIGAVEILPGADLPALLLIQVGLVGQLAVLHDRPLGAERAVEAAAVAVAGVGWRSLARVAAGWVPGPAFALRGGMAYAGTRALGEAVLARLSRGEDLVPERVATELRGRFGGVLERLGV
ncbi:MAG: hypothetical protein QOD86_165 [Miltoncostaeaceae bacterium]|nr:hypothetical protein [Miltoncostaeaceae bacterium]